MLEPISGGREPRSIIFADANGKRHRRNLKLPRFRNSESVELVCFLCRAVGAWGTKTRNQRMRKQLLVSTAALLATLAYASAQTEGRQPGGQSGAQRQESPASGAQSQGRGSEMGQSKGQSERTQGQGSREQSTQREPSQGKQGQTKQGQTNQGQGKATGQTQREEGKGKQGQTTGQGQREQGKGKGPTGQSQREQTQQGKQGQEGKQSQPQQRQPSQTTGQGQQGKQAPSQQQGKQAPSQQGKQGTQSGQTTGQGQQGQQQGREQGQQGREQSQQNQAGRQDQSGRITLNTEQRTRIRQTVFAQSNVPRVNNVNFAVRVGTVVPARVRLVAVVPALIEIRPDSRDHEFFVVNDEIVVVDHSRRIVAVVDTGGSSGADLRGSRSGRGQVASFDNLSVEEIREVQLVLIQQGFDIGVADGRLGAKTREALISF